MDNDERIKKAYEFSASIIKELIVLSTATIVFTATFASQFNDVTLCIKIILLLSWILNIISISFGLFAMMKFATELDPEYKVKRLSIRGGMKSRMVLSQIVSFCFAILFTFIAASTVLF